MDRILQSVGSYYGFCNAINIANDDILDTPLKRCLTTVDLTLLGIGHMVGAGVFVLTGTVVRDIAGPGAVLSYLFAGIAAMLSSLCYAEFGARVPKAGSAYTYTYVTIGELVAFTLGWNIILEHMLGVASVARAWSGSFDALFNGAIKNSTLNTIGEIDAPWLSSYPDFVAFLIVLIVMGCVCTGARISVNFNSLFTISNLVVIVLIITVGFSLADGNNWTNQLTGGFLPFGFQGVFAGAATCFYAYIGFEGIAVAGEEANSPERSIPIATGAAMTIVALLYVASSAALTLMVPYFEVNVNAPFPAAFAAKGLTWARIVISVGALLGITTSMIGGLFSLPRAVYSIACDGLFFKPFAYVHPKTQTPLVAIVVFGLFAALFALFFDIQVLVEFLSIGTLLSFTIVAASVIILRYQPASRCQFRLKPEDDARRPLEEDSVEGDTNRFMSRSQSHDEIGRLKNRFRNTFLAAIQPERATIAAVCMLGICITLFWIVIIFATESLQKGNPMGIGCVMLASLGILLSVAWLLMYEQNQSFVGFQVPLVPFVPAIRFVIYFGYGIRNSVENCGLASLGNVVNYGGDAKTSTPAESEKKVSLNTYAQEVTEESTTDSAGIKNQNYVE